MVPDVTLNVVMSRLRSGDQEAASLIFRRFVRRLTALASRQFDGRFRSKTDPEDVVQSVYKSFFHRDGLSPFELEDWDSLWSLLATITVRKCSSRRNYWLAARRDVGREGQPVAEADAWWAALDQGPTPLQAAVLTEVLEMVLAEVPPHQRRVAELSLQGYTAPDTADRCGCSERTVARVVARLKERLRELESKDLAD